MPNNSLSVSVVVPIYAQQVELDKTLEALTTQTHSNYEIVVADDGSEPPVTVPSEMNGVSITLVRQSRDGFGLARARNTGAAAATGEVLIFLDCDMIPEPWFVQAHAAHHTDCGHAVVIGTRKHVEGEHLTPADIAAAGDSIGSLFADQEATTPDWIQRHLDRTDDLTSPFFDTWRIMSGGNLSVRKALWDQVGGADERFNQWGAEDNEMGHRLLTAGAAVIFEPKALAWHQGEGHEPDESERKSLREQQARLEQLIPDPSVRKPRQGRSFEVPQTVIRLESATWDESDIDLVMRSILQGDESDFLIEVSTQGASKWLRRRHSNDDRVVFVEPTAASSQPFAWVRIDLTEPAIFNPFTLSDILYLIRDRSVGTVWGATESGRVLRARLQRVTGRLNQLGLSNDASAAELFNEAHLDTLLLPLSAGFTPVGPSELAELSRISAELTKANEHLKRQLDEARSQVKGLQDRRVIKLVDRVGSILKPKR